LKNRKNTKFLQYFSVKDYKRETLKGIIQFDDNIFTSGDYPNPTENRRMYIIQVDENYWLVGIWRGWLLFTFCPSRALVYKTFSGALKAIDYYRQIDPDKHYTIQTIDGNHQQWLRQFEEVAS